MTDLPHIPLAGVIGHPIAHSRSPALHGYWLKRYGIKGHYIPMDVAQADLRQTLDFLPRIGFVGLNVTIPHKETVLALADVVTDRAALIGAANTLIFRKDGKIHADNTDGAGFVANLRQNAPNWNAQAGPAADLRRRWCRPRRHCRPDRTRRARNPHRQPHPTAGRGAARRFRRPLAGLRLGSGRRDARRCALWSSTPPPSGMTGKPDFRVPLDALEPGTLVTDLVYTPLMTQFLIEAQDRGAQIVDGLGMLLHQAAPGFERWFNHRPEVDDATRAAVLGL